MLPRVFLSRRLPDAAMALLTGKVQADIWEGDTPPSPDELIKNTQGKIGLLCLLTDKITDEFLNACPDLKVVSQMAVGIDNIDIAACRSRGILVGNTPGVLSETTADLAFALLLSTARRMGEAELFLRNGEWKTWSPMLLTGHDVHHATIGIIGLGKIGFEMARRAHGFQMKILYYNRNRNPEAESAFGAQYVSLDALLSQSDFVSLHCPLTNETRGLINEEALAKMKPNCILINTARGPVVDAGALATALNNGQIAGAGIDVFDVEPILPENPLISARNAILVPHIGSASIQTRTNMALLAVRNLIAGVYGQDLPHSVK